MADDPENPSIADIGEDALIGRLVRDLPQAPDVIAGPGDDCAIVRPLSTGWLQLLKTDCILEGVHFLPDTPPESIGWKAMARAISDIGAMGGEPQHGLVTLLVSGDRPLSYAQNIYKGIRRASDTFGVSIVGGETCAAPQTMISIALTGRVQESACITRSGGRPGDLLYVTGRLGGSFKSGHHLHFTPRVQEAQWLAQNYPPSAMMDISDGIAKDLPRLAAACNAGYWIDPQKIPINSSCTLKQALGDGEDYELLIAAPATHSALMEAEWPHQFPDIPLNQIGMLIADPKASTPLSGGWEHFKKERGIAHDSL